MNHEFLQPLGSRPTYSWEGEDTLARKVLLDVFQVQKGFHVDIGAHHPFNLSNTALFYLEGWRGINIDATPGSMSPFNQYRPKDTNLEVAVAATPGNLTFTLFSDPALNGFVSEETIAAHKRRGINVLGNVQVTCLTLNSILEEHAGNRDIDLMSIDVEGIDSEIIASLDMTRWRPKLIIVEVLGCHSVADVVRTHVAQMLDSRGYIFHSRLHFSCIFVDSDAYEYVTKSRELEPMLDNGPYVAPAKTSGYLPTTLLSRLVSWLLQFRKFQYPDKR